MDRQVLGGSTCTGTAAISYYPFTTRPLPSWEKLSEAWALELYPSALKIPVSLVRFRPWALLRSV
jgi:hypothetical protein